MVELANLDTSLPKLMIIIMFRCSGAPGHMNHGQNSRSHDPKVVSGIWGRLLFVKAPRPKVGIQDHVLQFEKSLYCWSV